MAWGDRSGRIRRGPELLWQQVHDDLLADIQSGTLKAGDKLPSDFDLAEVYQVSRPTVRRALFELAGEKRIVVVVGKGTYVAEPR